MTTFPPSLTYGRLTPNYTTDGTQSGGKTALNLAITATDSGAHPKEHAESVKSRFTESKLSTTKMRLTAALQS
jgi:hypothetical protein